ncbi:MAG TPA: Clp protease N-terminal domain-containing protein [Acidimicrobiales bacterium]|nr:Clp protease N-terminal domain-containing protein [Acidimicrobiales bacterium]
MFERFTDRARRVLVLAQEEARLLNHSFIGTEHLLLGLLAEHDGVAARSLASLDISLEAARQKVEETIGPARSATTTTGSPPFTPRARKVLELGLREALQLGHNYVGTEHILLGLVREGEGVAAQVLVGLGADLATVRQAVIQQLASAEGRDPQLRPAARVRRPAFVPTFDPPGDVVTIDVVRPGRAPEVFTQAHQRLRELVAQLGAELDAGHVHVSSVETDEGPGLRLSCTQRLDSSRPDDDAEGEPSGDAPIT